VDGPETRTRANYASAHRRKQWPPETNPETSGFDSGSFLGHASGMPARIRRRASPQRKRFPGGGGQDLLEAKRVISAALRAKFESDGTTISEFAKKIGTNRTAIRRILDEKNTAISFRTMVKALSAAGLKVTLTTRPLTPEELGIVGQKLLNAKTPTEEAALTEEFVAGFYGRPTPVPTSS
jgi:hypothetical protein